ncbi:MAG: S9 family peptidase [Bacteroidales bacterium]|nr:S9 family peptidase [Bacteroidales bacterium]
MLRKILLASVIVLGQHQAMAQQHQEITLEDCIYGTFYQRSVYGIRSMSNGTQYTTLSRGRVEKFSYETGLSEGVVANLPANTDGYEFSADEKKILYYTDETPIYRRSFTANYYVLDIDSGYARPVYPKPQRMASLSADGNKVAFVIDNNILIKNLETGSISQVTTDGEVNKIINGVPDWVYEEEFEFNKAYEFSPCGKYLAYIKFDESQVKSYTLQYFANFSMRYNPDAQYPVNYEYKYPKVGEANSAVSVHIYNIETGETISADLGPDADIYVPCIQWIADTKTLCISRMNRLQNKLELLKLDTRDGKTTKFFELSDSQYIEEEVMRNIIFINQGKEFVLMNEQTGNRQLHRYDISGKYLNAITSGDREVIEPYGYCDDSKTMYYKGVGGNTTQTAIYSASISGKKIQKISEMDGSNDAEFSSNYKYFINFHSSARQPMTVTVNRSNGKSIRTLENNERLTATVRKYGEMYREFFTWKNSGGTELDAYMIKPANYDPKKKYPVLVVGYNGPNSKEVNDEFQYNWHQLLAQKGYIIACTDTRGTGRKGSQFRKCTYGQLGNLETQDLVDFAKYLGKQEYIDGQRLGIWGWSYGGFMASNVMTRGAGSYKVGIAIAPVESWEYYDNIYTERYMGLPDKNTAGYKDNAPIKYADKLEGKLLLIYGSADDNVHPQNSMVFSEALIQANKDFDMMVYPNKNHGIYGGNTRLHLYGKIIKYIIENL